MAGIYIYSHIAGGGYNPEDHDLPDDAPAFEIEAAAPLPERVRLMIKEKKLPEKEVSESSLSVSDASQPYWVRAGLCLAGDCTATCPLALGPVFVHWTSHPAAYATTRYIET